MALEAAVRDLVIQFRKCHDMLLALQLTVVEDKPVKGQAALVDQLEDAILDVMGLLDECLTSARAAQKAVGHPVDLDRARRALTTCQERFHRIEQEYSSRLSSYEKLKDLATLGSERRGEWLPWSSSVKDGVRQCQQPLDDASRALSGCWQEIAERVGSTSVSVQTTNIGQKIITKTTRTEDLVGEEIP
jgi:hypothetical protein